MRSDALRADLLLLFAAAIWGAGFIAQKLGMDHMGPLMFTGLRLLIGALVLLPLVHLRRHRRRPRTHQVHLAVVSLVLLCAFAAQQIGIQHTTASKAGFITALYVIFTPIIGLAFAQRTRPGLWLCALLALAGLALLSLQPSEPLAMQAGDAIVLLAAMLWGLHVVLIARLAPASEPVRLAFWQFLLAGAGATAIALAIEDNHMHAIIQGLPALLYSAIFATAVAFTIQIVAQRSAPATHVAVLLSFEAVFAALFGALILHDRLSPREIAGASLVFVAVLASQIRPRCGAGDQAETSPRSHAS